MKTYLGYGISKRILHLVNNNKPIKTKHKLSIIKQPESCLINKIIYKELVEYVKISIKNNPIIFRN
jgi:hypothetical protein